MTAQSIFYKDLVEQLLYLDSIRDIQLTVANLKRADTQALRQAFLELEEDYKQNNRSAQLSLLIFVREVVDDIHPLSEARPFSKQSILTAVDLLEQAYHASDIVQMYMLLRDHKNLLNHEVQHDLEVQITSGDPFDPEGGRSLLVLGAISRLLGDRALIAKSDMLWGSYSRRARNFGGAMRRFEQAQAIARDLNDTTLLMMAAGARASLYDQLHMPALAAESYEEILEVAEDSDEFVVALTVYKELAGVYRDLGLYTKALSSLDKHLKFAQEYQLKDRMLKGLILRGLLLEDLGYYEQGEAEYHKAARLAESLGDQKSQFEAMNNSAASLLKRGKKREGTERFRQIMRTVERWGNPAIIAASHNNLGTALMDMGQPGEALHEFRTALPIKANSGDRTGEFITYMGIADATSDLGDKEGAKSFYTLALIPAVEVFTSTNNFSLLAAWAANNNQDQEIGGPEVVEQLRWALDLARNSEVAQYEVLLVHVLSKHLEHEGKREEAIALYRDTIDRIYSRDPNSLHVLRLHLDLARLLTQSADGHQEAYHLLEAALVTVTERTKEVVIDQRRAEIIAEWVDVYTALIDLLIQYGDRIQLSKPIQPLELAFNLHEAAKSRTFLAELSKTIVAPPAVVPTALKEKEARLLSLDRSLQEREFNEIPRSPASAAYRLQRLKEVAQELSACWAEMGSFAPEYARLRMGEPMTSEGARALLSAYSDIPMAFVSFFCDDANTTCFVMRSDDLKLHVFRSSIGQKSLEDIAVRLRRVFNGAPNEFPVIRPIRRNKPWARDVSFFDQISNSLLMCLEVLDGIELLCVAPHGPLHLIPFHALRLPDGRFVAERFGVTYCPSLSVLSYGLDSNRAGSNTVQKPRVYVAGIASRNDEHPEFFETDHELFEPELWDIYTDIGVEAATPSRILQQLDKHDILHITSHGYFDEQDPLNSGILLSNGKERPPRNPGSVSPLERNGYLVTARDFLAADMNSDLMTLRACSTGVQEQRNLGDEFDGLTRALLYAGSKAVLASLWNVDQRSSQRLLARFYKHWVGSQEPMQKWRALWLAQQEFLAETEEPFLSHPYHWAPMVLIGDWR
jgi:tetratricopeptide (TPR) repeat protein